MDAFSTYLALAGEWADWRGAMVVIIGVIAFIGSIYMLLASNYGARLGYLVTMVSLGIWMVLLSALWLLGGPGTPAGLGPRGQEPQWVPFKPDSAQAAEFQDAVDRFPQGWDRIDEVDQYPGDIDPGGEFDVVKAQVMAALARDAEERGLDATRPQDWDFRAPGTEPLPGQELPVGDLAFLQYDGNSLLFGVRIPATDLHPQVTVFAVRDKGQVFLYGLYFLIVSAAGLALHLWLLARYERTHEPVEGAEPVLSP